MVYQFMVQFCPKTDVLDIGCGTGYGTAVLAQFANSACGIDISPSAVRFARRRYSRPNLAFHEMDAQALTFPPRSFDLIVSTENFEHLRDQRGAVQEMARVLRPDGLVFVATPNPEAFTEPNPYHTHEFTYDELRQVLGAVFREVVILENSLTAKTNRGVISTGSLTVFGRYLDVTHLKNTHSFFCFCR